MKKYIDGLWIKYNEAKTQEEKDKVKALLIKERNACKDILRQYYQREERAGVKCLEICKHEKDLIDKINKILNYWKDFIENNW